MAVPKYIREVPRPVNTVVIDNGNDDPTRYAVVSGREYSMYPEEIPSPKTER